MEGLHQLHAVCGEHHVSAARRAEAKHYRDRGYGDVQGEGASEVLGQVGDLGGGREADSTDLRF